MKKVFIAVTLVLLLVLFFSCNKEKINEYENTIETLNSQIALLQKENTNLKTEIDNLKIENVNFKLEVDAYKLTDQYFYQAGVDEYINKRYNSAIRLMTILKLKFPTSSLLGYADKIISDSKEGAALNPKDPPPPSPYTQLREYYDNLLHKYKTEEEN